MLTRKERKLKLSQLLNGTATTTICINDEPVVVKYRTNLITEETQAQTSEKDDDATLRKVLSDTIVEWDLMDDNDPPKPVPCTDDILKLIDTRTLSGIWMCLLESSCPNVKTGNTSNAG